MPVKLGVMVACAALALGCSSSAADSGVATVPELCQPSGVSLVIAEPETYPGGTVTVHAAGRFVTCDGGPDVPVDVSARVFSPGDEALPLTLAVHTSRYEDPDGGLSRFFGFFDPDAGATLVLADATFDTPELGLYHLNLEFAPNLGAIQQEVLSMVDRRGLGSNTLSLPYLCDDFDAHDGLALCHENLVLHVLRDGVEITNVVADGFIADGDDVWTLVAQPDLSLTLTDYQLGTDGTLTEKAIGPTPLTLQFGSLPALAWSQGQLLLVLVPNVWLATVDGGTVELRDAGMLPELAIPEVAVTFLAGQGAIIGYLPQTGLGSQLCLLDFVHDTMDCKTAAWLASETDAVWAFNNSGSLTAWQIDGGPGGPFFTNTTTGIAELSPSGLFQESGFPFNTAFNGRSQNLFGLFAVSFGSILRRPLTPPQSRVAGYGFWPSFQTAVSRHVIWSATFDFFSNGSVISYIPR